MHPHQAIPGELIMGYGGVWGPISIAPAAAKEALRDYLTLDELTAASSALAALTPAADRLPYFTSTTAAALATFTAAGRALLDDADAAAQLTTLGISAFVQTILNDAAAGDVLTTLGISAFAQTLLDDAAATNVLTTLGVSAFVQTILNDAAATNVRDTLELGAANNVTFANVEVDGDLNHDGSNVGFFGTAPTTKQTALTTALTAITHTAPSSPDYAIQALVQNTGFGFVTADEGETVLNVIQNLVTRVGELETKLQAYGLLA